jgi:flagellar capping protein FliD
MVNLSLENQVYALNVKEAAMTFNTVLETFSNNDENSVFNSKSVHTSNEAAVSASLITENDSDPSDEFEIKVSSLASPQINVGNSYRPNSQQLIAGNYEFSMNVSGNTYDFRFNVPSQSAHKDTMHHLCNEINNADIGIYASTLVDEQSGQLRVILKSDETGDTGSPIFSAKDTVFVGGHGIVEYFGLNNVYERAKSAKFTINGQAKESLSNQFTYNDRINIALHSTTDKSVKVNYTPNTEQILGGLSKVIDCYNNLLSTASDHSTLHRRANKLIYDLESIIYEYKNDLESCGITMNDSGFLEVDPFVASQAASDGTIEELFTNPNKISDTLYRYSFQITLNPMDYLDKKVVTYPNFGSFHYPNPYITSMYSGMLFNYYC